MSNLFVDKISGKSGTSSGAPITLSGDTATLGSGVTIPATGITALERHITLDRSMWGTDQAASLSEEGIKLFINMIMKIPKVFGNGKKIKTKEDKKIEKKFRYWLK